MTVTSALQSGKQQIIQAAVARLNSQLPLKARQEQLIPALKGLHQYILHFLATHGRPPDNDELKQVSGIKKLDDCLLQLGSDDLVVLNPDGRRILGAYPLTTEVTPHKVTLNKHSLFAMCALDAVSVAPMFATAVQITSSCHTSNIPISIHMRDSDILQVEPGMGVMVGIRWQMPSAVAAHSMCLQMVFLKDRQTAEAWRQGDRDHISLFTLSEAVAFGMAFFLPLLS